MSEWISVEDYLPVNDSTDEWDSPFHEEEFEVLIDGKEDTANFWCCWDTVIDLDEDQDFIKEFDKEGVTHWKIKK